MSKLIRWQSKLVQITVPGFPIAGQRYFLPQDAEIDQARLIGIRAHFLGLPGSPGELPQNSSINGQTWQNYTAALLAYVRITLLDHNRQQTLTDMPLTEFVTVDTAYFAAGFPTIAGQATLGTIQQKKLNALRILTGESYLNFSPGIAVADTAVQFSYIYII